MWCTIDHTHMVHHWSHTHGPPLITYTCGVPLITHTWSTIDHTHTCGAPLITHPCGAPLITHTCFWMFNMQTLRSRVYIRTIECTPPLPWRGNIILLCTHSEWDCLCLSLPIVSYKLTTGIRDSTLTTLLQLSLLRFSLQKHSMPYQWKPIPCKALCVTISFTMYFMTESSILMIPQVFGPSVDFSFIGNPACPNASWDRDPCIWINRHDWKQCLPSLVLRTWSVIIW